MNHHPQWLQLSSGDTQKFQRILMEKRILGPCYIHCASSLIPKTTTKKSSLCFSVRRMLKNYIFGACTLQRIRSEHGVNRCSIRAWNVNRIVTGASWYAYAAAMRLSSAKVHPKKWIWCYFQLKGTKLYRLTRLNHTKRNANLRFHWNSEVLEVFHPHTVTKKTYQLSPII